MHKPTSSSLAITLMLLTTYLATSTSGIPFTARAKPAPRFITSRQIDFVPQLLQNRKQTPTNASSPSDGYTLDECRFHRDCVGGRLCITGSMETACVGQDHCICFGKATQLCRTCKECLKFPMETCAHAHNVSQGLCVASSVVSEGSASELGCDSFPDVTPIPEEEEEAYNDVYDGSSQFPSSGVVPGPGLNSGTDSVSAVGAPANGGSADEGSAPENDGSQETGSQKSQASASCIDAELMKHFRDADKVFARDRPAGVLCDARGSCATPGHMVVYRGEAMMMREFCERVDAACVRRVVLVNSPTFVKGLRVASRSDGLEFTAFAARFESRVEARALAVAIRLGL